MASKAIISGVVVSRYDEKRGPIDIACFPEGMPKNVRNVASTKSFSLLAADQEDVPKGLEIVSFPAVRMKGIIKFLPVPDATKRGGISYLNCIIVFHEEDDVIFYKYIRKFEPAFNNMAKSIVDLETTHADATMFADSCKSFYKDACVLLDGLAREEKQTTSELVQNTEDDSELPALTSVAFKIVVCGNPAVGKTSLILRFTNNAFNKTYIETMGTNLFRKNGPTRFDDRVARHLGHRWPSQIQEHAQVFLCRCESKNSCLRSHEPGLVNRRARVG